MWKQYDREELYQKVWDQPLLKIAEEYGVSSVALGKTCRKLSVPVPGRGHWAKLAHGHEGVKKPPLPKLDTVPVVYRIPVEPKKPTNDPSIPEFVAIDKLLASGALNPPPIDPADCPHPLLRATASRLRSLSRRDENGILQPREPGGLDVQVSAGTLDRALHVMGQVLAVLERHGCTIEVSDQGRTTVIVDGQRISFGIEEPIRKVITQKPRVANPTDRWDYDEVVTYEPSGKLSLSIQEDTSGSYEQRKRWGDAKVQRLEDRIADFVATLMRTAVALTFKEKERKRREAEEQKRARERAQLQHDIEEEEEKLKQFNEWSDEWEKAERLRRFIAAYAEKSRSWGVENRAKHEAWIAWATCQADRIDPFVAEKPPSVLDRKNELQRYWG